MTVTDRELIDLYPGEPVDHDNAFFYWGLFERKILMLRCNDCGRRHHPAGPVCPTCWSTSLTPTPIGGGGTVHLLIRLHQGPYVPGIDYSTPYPVATVELDEQPGLRITAALTGPVTATAQIGTRVRLSWIERGGIPVPAFTPVED